MSSVHKILKRNSTGDFIGDEGAWAIFGVKLKRVAIKLAPEYE